VEHAFVVGVLNALDDLLETDAAFDTRAFGEHLDALEAIRAEFARA
jgi:hypothetical protein